MSAEIPAPHKLAFNAMTCGRFENFALMACNLDGLATSAIVCVSKDGDAFRLFPLFVAVTQDMRLTDTDGQALER